MKIDMSPEAVTNRLRTMEQLWELSVNLMQAREIGETNLSNEKSSATNWDDLGKDKAERHSDKISSR